jgi:hypothetical protein
MMTPRNEAAFSRKTEPEPAIATSKPPIAGPTARDTLKATLVRVIAAGSSLCGTSSGTIACHAGLFNAAPSPNVKVRARSNHGFINPAILSAPINAAMTSIQVCVTRRRRRRSIMSARAPAGSARSTTGKLPAVSTSATRMGDVVNETISHDSPTSCIHVPRLEAIVAIHRTRNTLPASGLNKGNLERLSGLSLLL